MTGLGGIQDILPDPGPFRDRPRARHRGDAGRRRVRSLVRGAEEEQEWLSAVKEQQADAAADAREAAANFETTAQSAGDAIEAKAESAGDAIKTKAESAGDDIEATEAPKGPRRRPRAATTSEEMAPAT
jgi:hypothetical protein